MIVEKNKCYDVRIDSVSSDGNGVCKIDGYTVFVPMSVRGDELNIKITKTNKTYGFGTINEIKKPADKRQTPPCPYYFSCGGCSFLHMLYDAELDEKKLAVENAMERIGGFKGFRINKINGMSDPYRYRNKMIFPVGKTKSGKTVCGFYAGKSHDIIPLEDCLLGDRINAEIITAVKKYMSENNVSAYEETAGKGVVRRIFTRTSKTSGEVMVVISANADSLPNADNLIKKLTDISEKIVSIILNVNKKRTNLVLGDTNVTLYGKDALSDSIFGLDFMVSPQSFFQVNPIMTDELYAKAIEFADISQNDKVFDIYCGIGTISLCAAKYAQHVTGIEISQRAVADAKENAVRNNINNTEFFAGSAENIVPKLISEGEKADIVILDPPRKGSDEKTLGAIVEAEPKRIVYVSCNPSTLARDCAFLATAGSGYEIQNAESFDMFPHTTHVETVVVMSKKSEKALK